MIWIFGGTSDANKIATSLTKSYPVIISTATGYGNKLAKETGAFVKEGRLDCTEITAEFNANKVKLVIDATHPFASEVSLNAIKACKLANLPYVRYERQSIICENAFHYCSYDEMLEALANSTGNILLTIGSNNLIRFAGLNTERLVARVLPVNESLEKCAEAGIMPHQIIATKGKFSTEMNLAFIKEYQISHIVMKESGAEGGTQEKIEAAKMADISVHILKRPEVPYPLIATNIKDLEHYISKFY